jgi:hypothetical protein
VNWTRAEAERRDVIIALGCVACRLEGRGHEPTQIHHLTTTGLHGGARRGHYATVGLCPWHHQGQRPDGLTRADMEAERGPSLALQPRAFREKYGRDDELLDAQNAMIAAALRQCEGSPF